MITEIIHKTGHVRLSRKRDGALFRAFDALGLVSKNLSNSTVFLINQVLSSYSFDEASKLYQRQGKLHDNQQKVLDFINAALAEINTEQSAKRAAKIAKEKAVPVESSGDACQPTNKQRKPTAPFVPLLLYSAYVAKKTLYQILNNVVLQGLVKRWSAAQAHDAGLQVSDYELLPGAVAQSVIFAVKDSYTYYFDALAVYTVNPAGFTGRPRAPGYLPPNGTKTVGLDMAYLASGKLIGLKNGGQMYTNYAKTSFLDAEALAAYAAVDISDWTSSVKKVNGYPEDAEACQLRLVCKGRQCTKVEIVFTIPNHVEQHSFLGEIIGSAKTAGYYGRTTKSLLTVMTGKQKQKVVCLVDEQLQKMARKPVIAGCDLGLSNFATLSFAGHTPLRGMVISGKQFNTRMAQFGRKTDKLKQLHTTKAVAAIKARHAEGHKLSKAEQRLLHAEQRALYSQPDIAALLQHQNAYVSDTMHKLSDAIVRSCVSKKVAVMVIGKNEGWKQEVELGRRNNRAFYAIPHATLIELLRYKAYEHGIIVLTTEESYTSKTSFLTNAPLQSYTEQETQETDKATLPKMASTVVADVAHSKTNTGRAPAHQGRLGGVRGSGSKRHRFTHNLANQKKRHTHADANGAYNMLRKVFSWFGYKDGCHSVKADIYALTYNNKRQLVRHNLRQLTG